MCARRAGSFLATDGVAYFNTAAVGLASRVLVDAYRRYIDDWAATGLDYVGARPRGSARGGRWLP